MSNLETRLTKNSIWLVFSRFAAQGLAVVFTVLLARRLGTAEFGAYAFIAAILFVANALTTFGTDMLLIREIAAKDDLSGLPAALIVQLALSFLFIALVWSLGAWIPNQSRETIMSLKVYSLALIPLAFFTVFTTALRGKQLMDLYALLNIAASLLQLGAVLILRENNLVTLASFLLLIQILVAVFAGLICCFAVPHFWRSWHVSSPQLLSLLKAAAPIAVLALLTMLYQRLGVTMLSLMTTPSDTGIFSVAARVIEASKTVHIAVFAALYPAMAQGISRWSSSGAGWLSSPKNLSKLGATYRDQRFTIGFLLAGAILISLLLFAFAKPLIALLYGNEYISSIHVLQILAWTLIPFTVNTYLTLSFLASKQEQLVGWALTVSLLGMLILNLWWIPARGPEGGAWALLIAECLQSVILLASARSFARISGEAHEFPQLP